MSGDSVHVGGTLLGQSLSNAGGVSSVVLNGDLSNETGLLHLDHDVSDALSGSHSAVFSSGSVSLLGTVVLSEGVDSNLTSHVELVSDGGSSNVDPVLVIWGEILVTGSLIVSGPLLNIILN